MSVRAILQGASAALVIAGTMGFAGTAAAEDWKCYTYQSAPASPINIGLQKMADKLNELTNGDVTVKCSVGGSLPIDPNSIAPAMSDGVLDFGTVANISGYVPLAAMGILPGMFASNAEYDEKGWPILKAVIEKEFDKRGIKVLGNYHYPPQVVWGSKSAKPLDSLDDLKGKTLRVSSPEVGELAKALGAIPVTLTTPDVAPAMQRGTVEYVITAAAAGGRLWRDFFGSGLMDQIYVSTNYIVMNSDRWDSLNAEQQAEFEAFAIDIGHWITKTQEDDNDIAINEFQKNDGWIIKGKSATAQARIVSEMKPVWKSWAEERGPEAVALLETLTTALGHDMM